MVLLTLLFTCGVEEASTINFLGFTQLPLDLPCVDTRGRKIPPGAWLSLSSSSLNPVGPFRAWKGLQHCCELLQRLPGTPVLPWVTKPHHPTNGLSSTPLLGLLYFLLFEQNLWDWISKLTQSEVEDTYRTVLQIKGVFFSPHLAHPTSCFWHAVPRHRASALWSCMKSERAFKTVTSISHQKQNTSYKESTRYSWIINEDWYFCAVQIGGILHIVRIPILFSWCVVPSAARCPRRCVRSPEITSALHYRYHISIIYTLSDKWKCFHKNNLESWLKTQACCQGKQSSLKEDLFLFCSDKYVVSGL